MCLRTEPQVNLRTILLYGGEFWVLSQDTESKINSFATSGYGDGTSIIIIIFGGVGRESRKKLGRQKVKNVPKADKNFPVYVQFCPFGLFWLI